MATSADEANPAAFERLRRMFEQAPGFICLLRGPQHVFEFRNEAHKRLFGERGAIGKSRNEIFADLPDDGFRALLDRTYATGERYVERARRVYVSAGPGLPREERFLDFVLQPMTDEGGEVVGIFVEGFDVTEQVRAQDAVQESELRLSAAIAIARLGGFELQLDTRKATLDARAREIYGFAPDEPLTVDIVRQRIDSDDAVRITSEMRAEPAGRREFEYRVRLPDGSTRNVVTICDMVTGRDQLTARIVGVFDDVTERRRAEARQRMLSNELNHRVKNTLATVQSIAAQTLRSASDMTQARDAFEARLVALAAAHDLLTAESWQGAALADVAAAALRPFDTVQRPQISRSGPHVWLTAPRALALTLALHELATNAVKYGALSTPEGRVTIRWSREAEELTLCWTERGGPPVIPPTRSGFGSRLLQRSLARELAAEVALSFAPEGARCEIRCKLEAAGPAPAFDSAPS